MLGFKHVADYSTLGKISAPRPGNGHRFASTSYATNRKNRQLGP
jgi:hypothetical protein